MSKIRIYGNTTVMNSTSTVKKQAFGRPIRGQIRDTCVLVKRGGQWLEVLHQMTPIVLPKADVAAGVQEKIKVMSEPVT